MRGKVGIPLQRRTAVLSDPPLPVGSAEPSFFGVVGASMHCILEAVMDKDRVQGSVRDGGKVEEGAGKLTGDQKLQGEGKLDQAKGKVQNAVGGIKDALKGKSSRPL